MPALLTETLLLVLASVLSVALFVRAGLPAVLGYLVSGALIGPHGLGLLAATEGTRFLGDLGVVFLMFMLGLEFSFPALRAARREVLGAGSLQVAFTCLIVAGGAALAGLSWPAALVAGGAVAMSSTAITLKQLADQGELGSAHGRLAMGILLFQDLATVPFLIAIGAPQTGTGPSLVVVARQLALAAIALGVTLVLSRRVFHLALGWAAGRRSADLFLLCVLLLTLGTAYGAHVAGISPAIGAFLAGTIVGEGDFRHQVEDDIRPFRDALLGLFFVTVGMQLDPSILASAPLPTVLWLLAIVPGKLIVTAGVTALLRWPWPVGLRVALVLAHGGEFALLLLTQAMATGIMTRETGQPALLAIALSLAIAPLLIQHNAALVRRLSAVLGPATGQEADAAPAHGSPADHVLICGCGRIGRLVVRALEAGHVPCLAIESDFGRFRDLRRRGHTVLFGDATRRRVLEAAGLDHARLLVVTFDHVRAVERVLHHARQRQPRLKSLVSAADDRDVPALVAAGATVVFAENLAAGLGLADRALLLAGFTREEAARVIEALRLEINPELGERARARDTA